MGMGCLHVSANLESVSGSGGDVRFGSLAAAALVKLPCPLYPRKLPRHSLAGMAAKGHKQTLARPLDMRAQTLAQIAANR